MSIKNQWAYPRVEKFIGPPPHTHIHMQTSQETKVTQQTGSHRLRSFSPGEQQLTEWRERMWMENIYKTHTYKETTTMIGTSIRKSQNSKDSSQRKTNSTEIHGKKLLLITAEI